MQEIIKKLWPLKRSLVSDGYDKALEYIAQEAPLKIFECPSGKECWTWIVPDKWICHEAYLETLDGKRLIDYQTHPLHCVEYSIAVDKVVKREELFKHLYTHPRNPKAIPYVFKFYERDWGLCCSQEQKQALKDTEYRVVIKSEFKPGTLKVGEWWLPGQSDEIIVLAAHLCHPYIANDDLSGVAVGLELMRRLAKVKDRHYTYLLLLVPETIGSIAWLSQHEDLIPKIKSGIFLEMLGTDCSLALQRTYAGDTQLDKICEDIIFEHEKDAYVGDFWEVIRNDELEYNSPRVRIPMVSISRVLRPNETEWPYPEYHTHFDTPDIINNQRLNIACDIVFKIILALERNCYPQVKFKGQICCSRYGIFPKDAQKYRPFFKTMFEMDGNHSIIDIAQKHSLRFTDVLRVIEDFSKHDLVSLLRSKLD